MNKIVSTSYLQALDKFQDRNSRREEVARLAAETGEDQFYGVYMAKDKEVSLWLTARLNMTEGG